MSTFLFHIDTALFIFINASCSNPFFDYLFPFITELKNWYPLLLVALLFFTVIQKDKKRVIQMILLSAVAIGLSDSISSQIFKDLICRFRPCNPAYFLPDGTHAFLPNAHFLLGHKDSWSFPSSHAMNNFTVATLWTLFFPRKAVAIPFFTVATLVGLSRIYCGVHYPSDVIGGALLGALLAWGIFVGYRQIEFEIVKRKKR